MEKRRLGRTDMDVTVLGFGGAGITSESIETIGRVLNSALDAGINVIDTAECYESGEESIGDAISKRRAVCESTAGAAEHAGCLRG